MPTGVQGVHFLPETFKIVEFRDKNALEAGILRGMRT